MYDTGPTAISVREDSVCFSGEKQIKLVVQKSHSRHLSISTVLNFCRDLVRNGSFSKMKLENVFICCAAVMIRIRSSELK